MAKQHDLDVDLSEPKKLVDWKNPPDLLELKADYDEAQSSHTSHVLDVDNWNAEATEVTEVEGISTDLESEPALSSLRVCIAVNTISG